MGTEALLALIVVGLAIGWATRQTVRGGFGSISDVMVALTGAAIGSRLIPHIYDGFGDGLGVVVADSAIGALVIMAIYRVAFGPNGWRFMRR